LSFGHDNVGPVVARPLQNPQADRIDRDDHERAELVSNCSRLFDIFQTAEEIRLLQQYACRLRIDGGRQLGNRNDALSRVECHKLHA